MSTSPPGPVNIPGSFYKASKGYLLTDGYSGYNNLPGVTNVGCWAHARRGFSDAIIAGGGKKKKPKALEGLEFCNRLFNIEKELRELTPEERYKERLLRSKPVLEEFSGVASCHQGRMLTSIPFG